MRNNRKATTVREEARALQLLGWMWIDCSRKLLNGLGTRPLLAVSDILCDITYTGSGGERMHTHVPESVSRIAVPVLLFLRSALTGRRVSPLAGSAVSLACAHVLSLLNASGPGQALCFVTQGRRCPGEGGMPPRPSRSGKCFQRTIWRTRVGNLAW